MDSVFDLFNNKRQVKIGGAKKSGLGTSFNDKTLRDKNGKWISPNSLTSKQKVLLKSGNSSLISNKNFELKGAQEELISQRGDVATLLRLIETTRNASSHNQNERSSRSHCLVTVIYKTNDASTKFTFVDLAGSERIHKSGSNHQKKDEAVAINKSLTAFGRVIKAITNPGSFVPYRDSVLTLLLKESIGGNSCTAIVIAVSPEDPEETVSSIRFGTRAIHVRNAPKKNAESQEMSVEEAEAQLEKELSILEVLKDKGFDGHVDQTFPPSEIKSYLSNKERMMENQEKAAALKFKIAEKKSMREDVTELQDQRK
eukprot:TRINITY_DN12687_c0_g1_i1.p1 TRINITY_DN12687_c0_g1~~TRINITY_DN12687_c0_g1_i1.p1  ORF type:complete len:314 (+),score=92.02 TRINITY_DN12687_c0_g1_i1:76-1017(+)